MALGFRGFMSSNLWVVEALGGFMGFWPLRGF